jgi:CRP/FNR family transcriptional regulator, cyclic AMP receptor protein
MRLKEENMRSSQVQEAMGGCPDCSQRSGGFLSEASIATRRAFEAIKSTNSYRQGAFLFSEGEMPRGVFVLCQGRAKLSLTSSDGKVIIMGFAEPGEALGLNAAVLGTPYEMTVELLEGGHVHFARRDDFVRFLREHADACVGVAAALANSYHGACEQLRTLGLSGTVRQKLSRLLVEWSNGGEPTRQGIRVKLPFTHEEIAQSIGSSRETVTRTLAELKHRQFTALNGSTLVIQNRAALGSFLRA